MDKQRFTIFSIEDNEPDFELLKTALDDIKDIAIDLINIQNGGYALDFLQKNGQYSDSPTPDIIILDINLPNVSGHDILEIIKNDKKLKVIPVIVFSTSDSEQDIKKSYELYANSYITKTFDIEELFSKISAMAYYWLKTSELPSVSNCCFVHKISDENDKI